MSFLSKILARRRERRPPKRSAAHIPRGIATDLDSVWDGPSLGPDAIPAIPRSPIDYAFNPHRQVWQPQPRPVSPILPIQADAHRQQRLRDHQRDHRLRHQASTGDLERIVYFMSSPTASTFSTTSLPPPPQHHGHHEHHDQPLPWLPNRHRDTLESFDVGSLPIEGPAGSVPSAADRSSSEDKPTPRQDQTRAPLDRGPSAESAPQEAMRPHPQHFPSSQVLPHLPRQPDQEEYVESLQEQARPAPHPQHGFPLPDQVEYLSDDSGSNYEDEAQKREPQGLEQFGRGSKQPLHSLSTTIATNSKGPFLAGGDEDEERDTEDKTYRPVQPSAHHQEQYHGQGGLAYHGSDDDYEDDEVTYGDDTVSELSSYSAAAAAFPLATSTIGLATTIDEESSTVDRTRTKEPAGDGSATALSPPPRQSASSAGQRWTPNSHYGRASSNVMDFTVDAGSSRDGSQSRLSSVNEDLGRASWVSSVSSYYGSPENAR